MIKVNKMNKRILTAVVLSNVLLMSSPAMAGWFGGDHDGERCRDKAGNHSQQESRYFHKQGKQDLALTADEVRTLVASRLIYKGNDRLKVGEIKAGEKDTFTVEVTTLEDSLVEVITIGGATGFPVASN
jgi:hypothetical protein